MMNRKAMIRAIKVVHTVYKSLPGSANTCVNINIDRIDNFDERELCQILAVIKSLVEEETRLH